MLSRQNIPPSWREIATRANEEGADLIRDRIRGRADELDISEDELVKAYGKKSGLPGSPTPEQVYSYLDEQVQKGWIPYVDETVAGTIEVGFGPMPITPEPMIMFVETYALTSFLGDYGAGKTIKTFSLLPNEKTKISIKTWRTSETTTKQASTVLDSWTRDTSDTFEKSVQSETSTKTDLTKTTSFEAETTGEGHFNVAVWGVGGTHKVGYKENWNDSRETFAKDVSNVAAKHIANASAKRNVEVNTSFETKMVTGEEQSIVRELENINAGRVLNFVFRQLNQEYITYLHLVDIKLAFSNGMGPGTPYQYREFRLSELEDLLDYCVRDKKQDEQVDPKDEVRKLVVTQLTTIADYKDTIRNFIECVDLTTGKPEDAGGTALTVLDYLNGNKRVDQATGNRRLYLRVRQDSWNAFYRNDADVKHKVDGIVMAINKYILPTDSVIVDALLGQAEALDKYSQDSRKAVIDQRRIEIEKANLANQIVRNKDGAQADIFAKVYPPQMVPPLVKVEEKEIPGP